MEIFATVYYVLSYSATIPTIYKLIKTKSSNDYSLVRLLLAYIGILSWTIYIVSCDVAASVIAGAVIDLTLLTIEDLFILKYYKFDKHKIL